MRRKNTTDTALNPLRTITFDGIGYGSARARRPIPSPGPALRVSGVKIQVTFPEDALRRQVALLMAAHPELEVGDGPLKAIADAVAAEWGTTGNALRLKCREPWVAVPRMVAYYLQREITGLSSSRIGAWWGKDHKTVFHGCQTTQNRMDTELVFRARVEAVRTAIQRRAAQ